MQTIQALTTYPRLIEQKTAIESWFNEQWRKTKAPFYGSVDLRNAGFKLAPVDTNLFPAGFNNLNPDNLPLAAKAAQVTIAELCPNVTKLLLIPESHSRNMRYFESLWVLTDILERAGLTVSCGSLDTELKETRFIELPNKRSITLTPVERQANKLKTAGFTPDCILLNNDLSSGIPDILQDLEQALMPSLQLGWSQRLKSIHFDYYQQVCSEFSLSLDCDPWFFNPLFSNCPEVNFMTQEGQQCLYHRAQQLLRQIQYKYEQYHIKHPPFLVIKADAGTYGMAVMMIQDADEILNMNRKKRTRMSTIKGGQPVTKAILQEGIYSFETSGEDKTTAEPVIYSIGRETIGGFYRSHKDKAAHENLNSPGMTFSPFQQWGDEFYDYSVIARLAMLSAARETAAISQ